jgi:hypothetical protein
MVDIHNPSYLRGRDQEDLGLRPAQANSLQDLISKIPNTKRTGGVAQVVVPSKHEVLSSNPNTTQKKSIFLNCICTCPLTQQFTSKNLCCR